MSLEKIWGTRYALVQSPMAGVQDERLALAVSAAGALGSLPAAMLDADSLRRKLQVLHASGLPYNVNFFTHRPEEPGAGVLAAWQAALQPYYTELGVAPSQAPMAGGRRPFDAQMAEVLEEACPTVVSFHFGLPEPALLARVKARGAFVLSTATTLQEALWLQEHGADGVIMQGLEAGGHRGHFLARDVTQQSGTQDLLAAVAGQVRVPLIAAGGIADAAGVAAALARGAAGVQVGTAFLLCTEAQTSPLHRARLRDTSAPTHITNLFSGGLARGMVNRLMQDLGPVNAVAPPFPALAPSVPPSSAPPRARAT